MIYDTSYSDRETTRKINKAVGEPFPWKKRWRLGGIGSKRMRIHEISEEYKKYMNASHYQSVANLELRPKGIIVHFRHKLQAYSWVMPYELLAIEYEGSLKLKCNGYFIQFNEPENDSFIKRMIELSIG